MSFSSRISSCSASASCCSWLPCRNRLSDYAPAEAFPRLASSHRFPASLNPNQAPRILRYVDDQQLIVAADMFLKQIANLLGRSFGFDQPRRFEMMPPFAERSYVIRNTLAGVARRGMDIVSDQDRCHQRM